MSVSTVIRLRDTFGFPFLGDGNAASRFRVDVLEPALARGEELVIDMEGVDNMTDSFSNACFAHLFHKHGDLVGSRIRFKSCTPLVRSFILNALEMSRRIPAGQ